MNNYFKRLQLKYDREIKNKCEHLRLNLNECLKTQFDDNYVCKPYQDDFLKCISSFDKEFRNKYNVYNFKTIY